MSEGAEKTAITEAIPPQPMTHEFVAKDAVASRLEAAASSMKASGFVDRRCRASACDPAGHY